MAQPKFKERLDRQDMEKVIKAGGSVLLYTYNEKGESEPHTISRIEELPTAVQLARNDEEREAAKVALEKQRGDIDHQLQQLAEAGSKQVERPAELRDASHEEAERGHRGKK